MQGLGSAVAWSTGYCWQVDVELACVRCKCEATILSRVSCCFPADLDPCQPAYRYIMAQHFQCQPGEVGRVAAADADAGTMPD